MARTGTSSALGAYAGSFPTTRRLEREEELDLHARAAAGDDEALAGLIEAHFPLLVKAALAFRGRGLPVEDLIGEACIGLMEAVSRFDPERGFRFMTYAVWWVRRSLVRALSTQARNVRIPRHRLRARATHEPVTEGAQDPLAPGERTGSTYPREVSLSESQDEDGPTLADLLGDESEGLESVVARCEEAHALHEALATLPERQRHVLARRFGLLDDETRTLQAVATEIGVTKERVRQIEGQALLELGRTLQPVLNPA